MKVKDLIKLIKGKYIIEVKNDLYSSELTITEKIMNAEVESIYTQNGEIRIHIDELKDIKSLEDLGYSFEVGM